jgi:signal transduction histidine kinase
MILGGVEIAGYSLEKGDLEKVGVTLERINTAVQKMKRFTSGLTDYTKMNSSKQRCNINKIIGDVLTFIAVQARFRNIKIVSDLDNNIPDSELDSDQVAQVLLNFLYNAADSIDEAGRKEGIIVIKSASNRDNITLNISDNGTGITEENREKMFKLHFTTKKDGHGYGLITCAGIIKNHGGRISINPDYKQGAEFTITLKI